MNRSLLLACAALLSLSACTQFESETPEISPALKAHVDLPPLIKLEGTIPDESHPDGALRVDGLLARRDKFMDQRIKVRGYLVEKYVRPEGAKRFELPHVWITDTPAGGDKRLMIVNIPDEVDKALQVGELYDITGTFATVSGSGFVLSSGLLIYESIDGLQLPTPKKRGRK